MKNEVHTRTFRGNPTPPIQAANERAKKSVHASARDRALKLLLSFLSLTGCADAFAAEELVVLDEIVVSGQAMAETLSANTLDAAGLASERSRGADTAELFRDVPGVSLNTGGGVSSLPAVHGLADDRLKIIVNGMNISSACSNHMNPSLSYVAPSAVGKAAVMAGITPVSQGGDSVGGTIAVEPLPPEFAPAGTGGIYSGQFGTFYRSVNDNLGTSGSASYASEQWRVDFNGAWSKARNYFQGGDGPQVFPTRFQNSNLSLKVAAKLDSGLWSADVSGQSLPYQGFPNQRMDMVRNDAVLGGLNYDKDFDWGKLDGKVYFHQTWHTMNTLPERKTAPMPMKSDGSDLGYRLRAHIDMADRHALHIGNEYFRQTLDDWWPGGRFNPMDFISVRNGERQRMGTFAEWQADWSEAWTSLIGLRNDTVWMDTGRVHGYSDDFFNTFWSDPFNAADRARTDVNFDVTALASYAPNPWGRYEIGFARKMRSPNLYERYAWTGGSEKSMITWFGDGNGYQGNLDIKPETAYNFSFSANWNDPAREIWSASVSPYYTHIVDYIWGRVDSVSKTGFRGMQFVNIPQADLYGVDAQARYAFLPSSPAGSFALRASLAYVRGVGQDGGRGRPCPYADAIAGGIYVCRGEGWPLQGLQAPDKVNLYHMMPLHGTIALEHELHTDWGNLSNYLGVDLVSRKTAVAKTYNEPQTPGYALVNVRVGYRYKKFSLDAGVDNLLDKQYFHPLGGVYILAAARRGEYSPTNLPAVPAMGRSVFVSLNLEF
jgi:iron complex outermembrane receptor protein